MGTERSRPRGDISRVRSERHGGPLRILVVEGHPGTLEVLAMFLKMLGRRAEFVPDAGTALAKAREHGFDVLLSELNLPGRDGCELLQTLHAQDHCPPWTVSMSARGVRQESARSRAAGFDLHLVKPFRPEELEAALR